MPFSEDIEAAKLLLQDYAGLDPKTEHGKETPKRFLNMLSELTQCSPAGQPSSWAEHHMDACVKWKTFPALAHDMVITEEIPFVSVCNHHVMPFVGNAVIGYIPGERVAGLSKFGRVVKHHARKLNVQEELTTEIGDFLEKELLCEGLAVVIRAEHTCMTLRGVQTPGALTTTALMRGAFADHDRTAKAEFYSIINGRR